MSVRARTVLALNVGSASLKSACYSLRAKSETEVPAAHETGRISIESTHDPSAVAEDHARKLLAQVAEGMPDLGDTPDVVAHRIVHGGDRPHPVELTQATLAELEELSALAPLHQPPALALARAATQRWPNAMQVGMFDTSWHHTMPEKHRVLPLPYALYSKGVKRYGFHGLAFQSAMRQLAHAAPSLAQKRVVLAHLGGGSSLCAVLNGRSVNTTMGMTPLGGIPMATRSGSLDPGVLLHLQRGLGLSSAEIDRLLWRESGVLGLSGESDDMRKLLASGSEGACRAINVYVSGVVQGIAAMSASIRGIDALVFSGGIGAHASEIRTRITDELGWMGIDIDPALNTRGASEISSAATLVKTFVMPVDEEEEMVGAIAM